MATEDTWASRTTDEVMKITLMLDAAMDPESDGGEWITPSEGRWLRDQAVLATHVADNSDTAVAMVFQDLRRGVDGFNRPLTGRVIERIEMNIEIGIDDMWAKEKPSAALQADRANDELAA